MINTNLLHTTDKAFNLLKEIWLGKDFQPFLEMLDEEATYSLPAGQMRGEIKGKENLAEMYKSFKPYYESSPLTVENIIGITSNETTVVYEFTNSSVFAGDTPYNNKLSFSFTIANDKIISYREYIGDISPVFLKFFLGLEQK